MKQSMKWVYVVLALILVSCGDVEKRKHDDQPLDDTQRKAVKELSVAYSDAMLAIATAFGPRGPSVLAKQETRSQKMSSYLQNQNCEHKPRHGTGDYKETWEAYQQISGSDCPIRLADYWRYSFDTKSTMGELSFDQLYSVKKDEYLQMNAFKQRELKGQVTVAFFGKNKLEMKGALTGAVDSKSSGPVMIAVDISLKKSSKGNDGEISYQMKFTEFTATAYISHQSVNGKTGKTTYMLNTEELNEQQFRQLFALSPIDEINEVFKDL